MATRLSRRALVGAALGTALAAPSVRTARAAEPGLRLGCLTDLGGPYTDLTGKGSVAAIQLAIEDFGRLRPDVPVVLTVADFGLKPDVGLNLMRGWFDNGGVDAVLDVPMSALALASVRVLEDKNKVGLITSAATSELTRSRCGPNHVQFASDTYALATTLVKEVLRQGGDTWFFIYPDYELGKSMVADASRSVVQNGGKVLGAVAHPFPGNTDFGSFLVQAQSSGAKVICLANAGEDAANAMKQAREFNVLRGGALLAVPFLGEPTIHSVGLGVAQGGYFPSPFYWEQSAGAIALADRHTRLVPNQRLSKNHANAYSGALHYLKTAAAIGVEQAKADGRAVVAAMKATGPDDVLFGPSRIRVDGQTMHDMMLLQVKAPAESRGPWDYCRIAGTLPAAEAYRPLNEGGCRLAAT